MSITIHEQRLLELLGSELTERPLSAQCIEDHFRAMTPEDWNGMMAVAEANRVFPLLLDALQRNRDIPVPMPVGRFLQQFAMQNSMAYYQKIFLLSSLMELLRGENITAFLLKGRGSTSSIPMRKAEASAISTCTSPTLRIIRKSRPFLKAGAMKKRPKT